MGKSGHFQSFLGFGTYRTGTKNPAHREALELALDRGVRVIDTSANYMDGDAERLVGQVLKNRSDRDSITVITKAGYIQGTNSRIAREKAREGQPFPEVVEFSPDLSHCIHPEFLEDQITRSIERLDGVRIDTLLLHNPEYFLKKHDDHREYYRRIENAFRFLEGEVKLGRIGSYGISSNTFIEPKEHPEYTSLETCIEIAEKIKTEAGSHHFSTIQFPLNLFESQAATLSNNGAHTVLELAQLKGLKTLANRPFNAFTQKHLFRLTSYRDHHGIDLNDAVQRTLERTIQIESEFPGVKESARFRFWGHILKDQLIHLVDFEQWKEIRHYRIEPDLLQMGRECSDSKNEALTTFWAKYKPTLDAALLAITHWMENAAAERNERLRVSLIEAVPKLRSNRTLSSLALSIYHALPGLDCVLVGMRTKDYVKDSLSSLDTAEISREDAFLSLDRAEGFLEEYERSPNEQKANRE